MNTPYTEIIKSLESRKNLSPEEKASLILAKKLDQQETKIDPELSKELLAQLEQAERYAFNNDQQYKIASLKNILR